MRVGEKVYCKNNLGLTLNYGGYLIDQVYKITKIENVPTLGKKDNLILTIDNITNDHYLELDFYTKDITYRSYYRFSDYFYTEKEYRKLKLQKIHNESLLS